jgi:hypothetical protein
MSPLSIVSGTSLEGGEGWVPIPANISIVPPVSPTAARFTGQLFDAQEQDEYPTADNNDYYNYL